MSENHTPPGTGAPDFEVGYKKPPVHSRFRPGQSGNPGGRRAGQRNFKTMVLGILEAEIDVTENGRRSKCTVAEALLRTLVQGGLKDRDIRCIIRALELYERFADKGDDGEAEAPAEGDLDIIRRAMQGEDGDRDEDHADADDDDGADDELDDGNGAAGPAA